MPAIRQPYRRPPRQARRLASPIRKEVNAMFDPRDRTLARSVQADRVRELERRALARRHLPARVPDPLRRRVGVQLMRLGARLAADQPLEPARSR
ncbi:MAG: hypothetical protein ACXWMX_01780 [Candidatus Limnocylindrales bacterium]